MSKPIVAAVVPLAVELNAGERYFFCTCGQSANQPFCDGAHRGSEFVPHKFEVEEAGTKYLCCCKQTGNTPFCDGSHKGLTPDAVGKPVADG